MKKFSLFLFLILAVAICAKDLDFRVYNKNAKRSISNAEIEATITKALNLEEIGDQYFRVGVNVYANRAGTGEDLVVYLYRKDSYTIDDYQVSVAADGSVSVTRDYVEPELDSDNEPCGTCPDETVEVIVSTPILDPNFYLAERNVKEAEKILNEAGIKTVKLLGENATSIDIIKNWLSCPNLKMYGRIGHGLDRTGEIVVGNNAKIGPSYWKANPGMLTEKIMMWNSCYVHSEPCKSALLSDANAYWFAAGNGVVLQAGPTKSEPVWLNWIKRALLNGEELSAALDAAAKDVQYYDYGRTGNPDYGPEHYWAELGVGVTVETPNGGEELIIGTDVEISWSTSSDDAVDVELLKNGSVVETIKSNVSSSTSTLTWTIPESVEPGNNYKIQVVTPDTSDASDEAFTIKLKPIVKIELEEIIDSLDVVDDFTTEQTLVIKNEGEGSLKYNLSYKSGNSVLINEIFTPHSEFLDGFELWNRGLDQDMTGWTAEWKDTDNSSGSYDFEDGFILKSGKTCVLTDDPQGTDANTFYVGLNLGWSIHDTVGTEVSITLYDADGNGVDFVKSSGSTDTPPTYGCSWDGEGILLNQQRLYRNSNSDTDCKDDWSGATGKSSVNEINPGQSLDGVGESWIGLSSKDGSVEANGSKEITVSFSSEELDTGVYIDTITVVHDDPEAIKEIRIPVTLHVLPTVATVVTKKSVNEFGMKALANSIQYQIPTFAAGEKVTINVYSLNGRLNKVLVNDVKKSGLYNVSLGNDLATGSYICKMSTGSFQKSMMIINR